VPSPKDVLGYHIGTPKKLTYYDDILKYYRTLAAKSPRVVVQSIGKTDEGRECVVVIIGSEETIKNLETYRKALGQLADPRALTDAQARDVIAKAKPMYHLVGGLHSGETGPSEMLMELAYRLVVEDSPLVQQDSRQRDRGHHAGGRARRRAIASSTGTTATRSTSTTKATRAACPTGASTCCTTTTGTSTSRW